MNETQQAIIDATHGRNRKKINWIRIAILATVAVGATALVVSAYKMPIEDWMIEEDEKCMI